VIFTPPSRSAPVWDVCRFAMSVPLARFVIRAICPVVIPDLCSAQLQSVSVKWSATPCPSCFFILLNLFLYFLLTLKESNKEKAPEKTTSPVCRQLRYAISRSDKHGEVRAFSGSLSHPAPFSGRWRGFAIMGVRKILKNDKE
jgi:hypothetical protein